MADPQWESARSRYKHERFHLLEETFVLDDRSIVRPIIHHPGAVAIVAQPDTDHLLMVRQFRYPLRRWTLEIPAGTREEGEDPLDTAKRELSEEAGMAAEHWREILRFFPALGVSTEEMILYQANSLTTADGCPDEGELVAGEVVALSDLQHFMDEGLICDAKTLIALAVIGAWPGSGQSTGKAC